ncbi:hypothetical protein BH10PLA1_BH10PLA1_07880 [soil metagenome]
MNSRRARTDEYIRPSQTGMSVPPKKKMRVLKSPNLKQLQKIAAAAIRGRLNADDRTPVSMRPVAESFIKPNDRLTSLERLEIYNRQYWFRLLDILYDDYPGLRTILSIPTFHEMSQAYLERYPSKSFTLRNLGSKLERFLAEQPQWAGKKQAMALDMVRFEWAQIVAFDGPAKPVLAPDALAKANPEKLKLGLQPYLTLLDIAYPLDDFILAVKRQNASLRSEASNAVESPVAKKKAKAITLPRKKRTRVVVHRFNNQLYYKRLEPVAFDILTHLQAGQPLAKACETAVLKSKSAINPAAIGEWFKVWTQLGWLCKP